MATLAELCEVPEMSQDTNNQYGKVKPSLSLRRLYFGVSSGPPHYTLPANNHQEAALLLHHLGMLAVYPGLIPAQSVQPEITWN